MIPVQILSRYDLEDRIRDGRRLYSHCISITDPDVLLKVDLAPAFRAVLALRFHDIDRRSDMPKEDRPRLPMPSDARKVVEFFRASRPEATGYTVHCHAGVHRSTAVGLALLYLETGSEKPPPRNSCASSPYPCPTGAWFGSSTGSWDAACPRRPSPSGPGPGTTWRTGFASTRTITWRNWKRRSEPVTPNCKKTGWIPGTVID